MRLIAVATLCLLAVLVLPATASAGQYSVASCQADQVMFSTRAFTDFATRGMSIRRACNPQGRGLRGLVTGNVVRRQPLRRGAVSLVAITAPSGTRFTTSAGPAPHAASIAGSRSSSTRTSPAARQSR